MVVVQACELHFDSQNPYFQNKMQGHVSVILALPRLIQEDPLSLYHIPVSERHYSRSNIREWLMNFSMLTSACLHPHMEKEVSHVHCPSFCFIIYKQKSVIIE